MRNLNRKLLKVKIKKEFLYLFFELKTVLVSDIKRVYEKINEVKYVCTPNVGSVEISGKDSELNKNKTQNTTDSYAYITSKNKNVRCL